MSNVFDDFEQTPEDHWIEGVIRSFEATIKKYNCSPELHILLGVARGIKTGSITKGDFAYAEIALKATADGKTSEIEDEIRVMAGLGCFTAGTIDGMENVQAIKRRKIEFDPDHWKSSLNDYMGDGTFLWGSLEGSIFHGFIDAAANTIRYGDPRFAKLGIDAAHKSDNPKEVCVVLECLAEMGFFGNQLLHGCKPDRSSAVNRLQ